MPVNYANAHFIKRSAGGLGIEENIVTLCPECHYEEDLGQNTKVYESYIENYLKDIYGDNWNKENLIYKKYYLLGINRSYYLLLTIIKKESNLFMPNPPKNFTVCRGASK